MHVQASAGALRVRFGSRFGASEVEKLREAIKSFAPVSDLVVDFGDVRVFEDVAIAPLTRLLRGLGRARVRLRGMTLHQSRMLRYFGVDAVGLAGERGVPATHA